MDRRTYDFVAKALGTGVPVVLSTVTDGPALGSDLVTRKDGHEGTLGSEALDSLVLNDARQFLESDFTGIRRYGAYSPEGGSVEVFFRSFLPAPIMYLFGAVNAAEPLSRIGALLGFEVTVADARAALVSSERFPDATNLIVGWPHEVLERGHVDVRTCICVLSHDPKFDVPVLEVALRGRAGYVGVLGSERTHELRLGALREKGISEEDLSRIHAPIGLNIGAGRPSEVAVAIAAEIVSEAVVGKDAVGC